MNKNVSPNNFSGNGRVSVLFQYYYRNYFLHYKPGRLLPYLHARECLVHAVKPPIKDTLKEDKPPNKGYTHCIENHL